MPSRYRIYDNNNGCWVTGLTYETKWNAINRAKIYMQDHPGAYILVMNVEAIVKAGAPMVEEFK